MMGRQVFSVVFCWTWKMIHINPINNAANMLLKFVAVDQPDRLGIGIELPNTKLLWQLQLLRLPK